MSDDNYKRLDSLANDAIERITDKLRKLPEPIMSQKEFNELPTVYKAILTCNVVGCNEMVSTWGLVCTEHTNWSKPRNLCTSSIRAM